MDDLCETRCGVETGDGEWVKAYLFIGSTDVLVEVELIATFSSVTVSFPIINAPRSSTYNTSDSTFVTSRRIPIRRSSLLTGSDAP